MSGLGADNEHELAEGLIPTEMYRDLFYRSPIDGLELLGQFAGDQDRPGAKLGKGPQFLERFHYSML